MGCKKHVSFGQLCERNPLKNHRGLPAFYDKKILHRDVVRKALRLIITPSYDLTLLVARVPFGSAKFLANILSKVLYVLRSLGTMEMIYRPHFFINFNFLVEKLDV